MRLLNLKPDSHDHRSHSIHRWHRTAEEGHRLFKPVNYNTMCEHCRNQSGINCPVCGPETDRIEPVEVLTKVTHCKNCPMGEYFDQNGYDGYNCHFNPNDVETVIFVNWKLRDMLADDQPLPDECPLRTKTITIKLNQ